jgi:NADH dehydrogenase FAD-containing subunit/uncharacterized membrane protein YphA (DoxX/SURF4 family)
MSTPIPVRRTETRAAIAEALGFAANLAHVAERSLGPLLDLALRLWLAQIFFVSAVLKLSNWENALNLSRYEYPVGWMDPISAAYLGVTIELVGSVLFALGLATRFAALALAALSLVIQLNYSALDAHLFWAVLFLWFAAFGAGRLSMDRSLSRGLADTAIPFAATSVRALAWATRRLAPSYLLLFRLWLAGAILSIAFQFGATEGGALLPLRSAAKFSTALEWTLAAMLVVGLATRPAALALIGLSGVLQVMELRYTEYVYWFFALGLLVLHGAGRYSADALLRNWLRRVFPQLEGKPAFSLQGLPRVVIVGAGFGGLTCALRLARTPVQITLIDRHNYHLFQPLLYQAATSALSPGDIAMPIRGQFRDQFNARVLLGTVTGVDTQKREVLIGEKRVPYDYLVLATGAAHSYFGKDQWAPYAPGLKRIEDATRVRSRILAAFERAEAAEDEQERLSLLTFLVVGGGPTGVELAGAIAELARFGMEKEFRHFDPAQARVILVQAGSRVLPTFPERLSVITRRSLEKLGVEVLVDSRVEQIDELGVTISGKRIAARTVLWAAGVVASPAAKWLGATADNAGRLKTASDLSVPGFANIFAIGDTALADAWNGEPVPGLAPAAKQGGAYVAKLLRARLAGKPQPKPFRYVHLGSLATIGRKAAVADFGFVKLWGAPAWWLWGVIHLGFLVGVRNRVSVMFDWFWAYLTFRGGTRLITGASESAPPPIVAPAPRAAALSQ